MGQLSWRSPFWDLAVVFASLGALALALFTHRRWLRWGLFALLALPPAMRSARAAHGYFSGTAELNRSSSRDHSYSRASLDLDPTYRVPVRRRSRAPTLAFVLDPLEDAVLRGLVGALGPVPGSYQGPYPSRDQALEAILAADVFASPAELRQPFAVGGRTLQLAPSAFDQALSEYDSAESIDSRPIALALIEGKCLALGFFRHLGYHVELIGIDGYGWFAHYSYGEGTVRLPPRR